MQQTRNFSSSPVADPCGATPSSAASESQDMSTFLNQFFHHKHGDLQHSLQQPQPPPLFSEDLHWPGPSEWESRVRDGNSSAAVESSRGVSVSDPSCCYKVDMKASSEKPFSSADAKERRASSDNYLDELSCESEGTEGSEVLAKSVQPRSSSKRSRAAEVHNLSEKRRRSRINEKMKALQNLIPNSNKTDKASMLDEAIEYLKQLQLQVQMLSMRNGLSLHPMFFMGVQQPMQLPQTGTSFDEGDGYLNSSRGMGTFYGNEESSRVSVINLDNRCTHSNLACVIPSVPNITIPETSLGFGESAQAIYEPLNLSSSKVIVGEGTQKLECDTGQIGKISQSDVS